MCSGVAAFSYRQVPQIYTIKMSKGTKVEDAAYIERPLDLRNLLKKKATCYRKKIISSFCKVKMS